MNTQDWLQTSSGQPISACGRRGVGTGVGEAGLSFARCLAGAASGRGRGGPRQEDQSSQHPLAAQTHGGLLGISRYSIHQDMFSKLGNRSSRSCQGPQHAEAKNEAEPAKRRELFSSYHMLGARPLCLCLSPSLSAPLPQFVLVSVSQSKGKC